MVHEKSLFVEFRIGNELSESFTTILCSCACTRAFMQLYDY